MVFLGGGREKPGKCLICIITRENTNVTADCHWELIGDTQNSERRKNLVNFPYFLNIGILWRMGGWSLNVEERKEFL